MRTAATCEAAPFSSSSFRAASSAGLANASCYSFEASNDPVHYLRHYGYRIRKDPDDGSWQFKQDATFCMHPGKRGANEQLWLANGTGSGRNSSINFLEDTTWWVVPAPCPQPAVPDTAARD